MATTTSGEKSISLMMHSNKTALPLVKKLECASSLIFIKPLLSRLLVGGPLSGRATGKVFFNLDPSTNTIVNRHNRRRCVTRPVFSVINLTVKFAGVSLVPCTFAIWYNYGKLFPRFTHALDKIQIGFPIHHQAKAYSVQ